MLQNLLQAIEPGFAYFSISHKKEDFAFNICIVAYYDNSLRVHFRIFFFFVENFSIIFRHTLSRCHAHIDTLTFIQWKIAR